MPGPQRSAASDAIPADYRPKLRMIEPVPIEHEGRTLVVLQDPQHWSEDTLLITPVAGLIVTLFDGNRTIAQICAVLREQCGIPVAAADVYQLSQELDRRQMLDSTAFREHARRVAGEFRAADRRKAFLAGRSYPAERGELSELLDSFFSCEAGPGLPGRNGDGRPMVRGAIIPHIDLRSGGPCFAHAYRRICEAPPAETYVILGTGHALGDGLFCATNKIFETPFGDVPADRDFIRSLSDQFGEDVCADEIYHRTEHVIEFQALFLQYLLGGRHEFRIAPILCAYSPAMAHGAELPYAGRIRRFAAALRGAIERSPRKICVIASVDLAHVGPRYNDETAPNPAQLRELEADDRRTLERIAAGDAEQLTGELLREQDNNRRRICGYPCIHTMLNCADFNHGELLRYEQAQVDDAGSVVSFTSMVFH